MRRSLLEMRSHCHKWQWSQNGNPKISSGHGFTITLPLPRTTKCPLQIDDILFYRRPLAKNRTLANQQFATKSGDFR